MNDRMNEYDFAFVALANLRYINALNNNNNKKLNIELSVVQYTAVWTSSAALWRIAVAWGQTDKGEAIVETWTGCG